MKTYTEFLNESQNFLRRVSSTGIVKQYHPKNKEELQEIIKQEIASQGGVDVDLNMIDTSAITDMEELFGDNDNIETLDVSDWDVSKVEDMSYMFYYCTKLKSVGDLSNWDISSIDTMSYMFAGCEKLESIGDISGWIVPGVKEVKYMQGMFNNCPVQKPEWYINYFKNYFK